MTYKNKLQFFFLLLTAMIFIGQELEHFMFHNYIESSSCYSHSSQDSKTKHSTEIKKANSFSEDILFKNVCQLCNSISAKPIIPSNMQVTFIKCSNLTYSQAHEAFSFYFCNTPKSRGPPIV